MGNAMRQHELSRGEIGRQSSQALTFVQHDFIGGAGPERLPFCFIDHRHVFFAPPAPNESHIDIVGLDYRRRAERLNGGR